jgi:hypothetical protein
MKLDYSTKMRLYAVALRIVHYALVKMCGKTMASCIIKMTGALLRLRSNQQHSINS